MGPSSSLSRAGSLPTTSLASIPSKSSRNNGSKRPQLMTREQELLAKRMEYGSGSGRRPRTADAYKALPKGTAIELRKNGYVEFVRDVNLTDAEADIEEALAIGAEEETTAAQRIDFNLRKMAMRRAGYDIPEDATLSSPKFVSHP